MFAHAIIGAGWGDEGKGLATDALAARLVAEEREVTVVRSNGGAQAGHGVTLPDGRHHVFHHVGSGSFSGAGTHLSQFFVCHPMVFFDEIEALAGKGVSDLAISADPRAPITTPWDMAINQALELSRSEGRHGSCGLGFGETLERMEAGPVLRMKDLRSPELRDLVRAIRDAWTPARMSALGLSIPDGPLGEVLAGSDVVLDRYIEDLDRFAGVVSMQRDAGLRAADAIIFEGAQGLRLDMDLGEFPHVTRSFTGLPNMVNIAREAGIDAIEATYMTRAYATRHGRGPLPHDRGTTPLDGTSVIDRTNVANPWQEAVRYAPLHLRSMERIIDADIARVGGTASVSAALGITCLDQVDEDIELCIFKDDEYGRPGSACVTRGAVADVISEQLGRPLRMTSAGPTRADVTWSDGVTSPEPA